MSRGEEKEKKDAMRLWGKEVREVGSFAADSGGALGGGEGEL